MLIQSFEGSIEPKILSRAEYYLDAIDEVVQVDIGEFSAYVQGTDLYEVFIKIEVDTGYIEEYTCDCPYDWGNECKHIVAVLFHIRNEGLLKTKVEGTMVNQLRLIINDISEKELKDFVLNYAKRNRDFREDFTIEFG